LRFPEFSGEWKEVKIGNITTKVGSGVTPKGGSSVYTNSGHIFIRSQNVDNGAFLLKDVAYIDDATHQKQKSTELVCGDVLLNITGASIGRSAVVNSSVAGGNVNQHVCIIRVIDSILPNFLCNYLLSYRGQKQIDSFQAGGNREGLNFEQIKSIKLKIPSTSEQNKITSLLSKLDERIAAQKKVIERLETLINGLNQAVLNNHGVKTQLKHVLTEVVEKTTKLNQYDVLSSTAKGLFLQSEYFDKEVASVDNVGYKILRKGQIVISPQNLWLGNINYNDCFEVGMVSPSYKIFAINDNNNSLYISLLMRTHKAFFEYANASEQGASIVRRNLNMDDFYAISFQIPSRQEQDYVASAYQCLFQRKQVEQKYLSQLEIQKTYLLSQMFI
jgi:type I restriction enzyme S subunit